MGSYYDIDDILAEEEFDASLSRLFSGSLQMELASIRVQRKIVTRLEIQADPANVDLRSRSPCFYEFGCKMAPITSDRTLGYFLFFAFRSRYKEVLTKAHTAAHVAAPKVLSQLTNEEINLYEAAQSSVAAFNKWRVDGSRFRASSTLGRKRRSTD